MEIRNSVSYVNTCGNILNLQTEYLSQGKDTSDECTIFYTDENLRHQRKLQKKREEQELKEQREQKERMLLGM